MRRIVISSKSIPYSDNIKEWISVNVRNPKNNCFFYSAVLAALDFSLTLKKGRPANPGRGQTAHFYLENLDGEVIDPTKEQLKKEYEYDGRIVDVKKNLDAIIEDKLFETLHSDDKKRILDMASSN